MSDLSQDQEEKRASIQKGAITFGAIVGVIVALIAVWALGGQGGAIRYGGALVLGGVAGFFVFRGSFNSGSKSAQCEKCSAAFSRSKTDSAETVISSADKEEREAQEDKSTKVTTWIEDTVEVVDTYTCAQCGDVTTNSYQTTRKRDEAEVIEPVAVAKTSAAGTKGDADKSASGKTAAGGKASSGRANARKGRK